MTVAGRDVCRIFVFLILWSSATVRAEDGTAKAKDVWAPVESYSEAKREHWAYQPLSRVEPPSIRRKALARNAIDRFVMAGLEEVEWNAAPEAERSALLRRVTYDLTGLPPSPEEAKAFMADHRPDAYERLVDRLLASPKYGERFGQHWLDLAHYADSNGFELDVERPDAWRYRDWVVKALNADLPYDRFLKLQIAGDDLAPGDHEALIATGFCRCGPRELVAGNIIPEEKRQNELTEITGTVGSVFLGLTIGCARCHDHKFDAIPTTDYYRLQAFFNPSELTDVPISTKADQEAFAAAQKAVKAKLAPLEAEKAKLEAPYRKALADRKQAMLNASERAVLAVPEKERTPAQKKLAMGLKGSLRISWEEVAAAVSANAADHARREQLKRNIEAIERSLPRPPAHAMALVDEKGKASDTFVLKRGDFRNRGVKVGPRPPGVVLASQPSGAFGPASIVAKGEKTGRRAALAEWLARNDNPLTSRVIVNRLWQYHFGRGIVSSPSDFGVRGEPPTHPELLDWLAGELIANGWRMKPIHRLMVTSAAYRQSSRPDPKQLVEDPDNSLLSHMNRRRMDAEGVRDAMLTVTGELSGRMGGPGILASLEKEIKDLIFTEAEVVDLWPENPDAAEQARRSLYLFRKRNVRYPLFDAFDAPDTQSACPRRETSTHALQALVLLNSDFAAGRAKALASHVLREQSGGTDERIQRMYERVLARAPKPEEVRRAGDFVKVQTERIRSEGESSGTDPAMAAWTDLALSLLNCNEFLYVP
jgi:hypothetical protein